MVAASRKGLLEAANWTLSHVICVFHTLLQPTRATHASEFDDALNLDCATINVASASSLAVLHPLLLFKFSPVKSSLYPSTYCHLSALPAIALIYRLSQTPRSNLTSYLTHSIPQSNSTRSKSCLLQDGRTLAEGYGAQSVY